MANQIPHPNPWPRYLLLALLAEKVTQHIFVTLAFYFDWGGIRSTVAVSPAFLMYAGAVLAILFALALWAAAASRAWAANLVIALALCDIIGEFVAQGTVFITVTVSFIVATALLLLVLLARRQSAQVV